MGVTMEIRAGGKVWDVETEASRPFDTEGESFCGVIFRDRSDREGRVEIGWVPRAAGMSQRGALRLFELAGERLWRDSRTGVIHRVRLGDGSDEPGGPITVRFITAAGAQATRYDLAVALGMADDASLQRLLDRALRTGPGSPRIA